MHERVISGIRTTWWIHLLFPLMAAAVLHLMPIDAAAEDPGMMAINIEALMNVRPPLSAKRSSSFPTVPPHVNDATTVNVMNTADYFHEIDDDLTADQRLAWPTVESMELAIVGQNLLDSGHLESVQEVYFRPTEVPHCVYGKVTYRF